MKDVVAERVAEKISQHIKDTAKPAQEFLNKTVTDLTKVAEERFKKMFKSIRLENPRERAVYLVEIQNELISSLKDPLAGVLAVAAFMSNTNGDDKVVNAIIKSINEILAAISGFKITGELYIKMYDETKRDMDKEVT